MVGAFDVRTALLMGGFTYLLMPLTVWAVLHARHDARTLSLWNAGSLLAGLGFCLIAARGHVADWLSIGVANALGFCSYSLRGLALDREAGATRCSRAALLWPIPAFALFALGWSAGPHWRLSANAVAHAAGSLWLASLSWRVDRRRGSRSARLLGWAFGVFGAGAAIRAVGLLLSPQLTPDVFAVSPGFLPWIGGGMLAGLYSNIGFLGLAVEHARGRELHQAADLARQQLLREQAEQDNAELTRRLGREEEVLRLLAHEVRQPLHNAMAVLQGARAGLQQPADPGAATQRIVRAEQVIQQIVGTLDNTLAATALLAGHLPAARHDADIDMLVSMSIADLPHAAQGRVQVQRLTATRTASLDPSLMRLALRNLLANACAYARDDSPVVLTLADQDEPPALLIEVADRGPGLDPAVRERLFEAGTRGPHGQPGHGLGLYVVHRVMTLHGGEVAWYENRPHGTAFRLVLPQD